jgi:hypothetical protein
VFSIDATFTHVPGDSSRILFLHQAINAVAVKVPGMPLEPATAYVAAWQAPGGASLVIYLHYKGTNQRVAYCPSPAVVPTDEVEVQRSEAADFLESMGFLMDDTGFAALSPAQQAAIMARTPLFHADLENFKKGRELDTTSDAEFIGDGEVVEEAPSPDTVRVPKLNPRSQAVARLLMSF